MDASRGMTCRLQCCSAACITRLYKYISVSSIYFIYMSIVGAGPGRCRKPKWSRLHCILYRCHCSVLGWQLNPTRFDFRFLSRQASSPLAANIFAFACSCGISHKRSAETPLHSWKSWLRLWFALSVALHRWRNCFSLGLAKATDWVV